MEAPEWFNNVGVNYPELEKIITESDNRHRIHMRDDKYKNNNQYYKIINYKYNMIPKNILQKFLAQSTLILTRLNYRFVILYSLVHTLFL